MIHIRRQPKPEPRHVLFDASVSAHDPASLRSYAMQRTASDRAPERGHLAASTPDAFHYISSSPLRSDVTK